MQTSKLVRSGQRRVDMLFVDVETIEWFDGMLHIGMFCFAWFWNQS